MTMLSTRDTLLGLQNPPRVQSYLDELVLTCAQSGHSLVSVVLFGSPATRGFSSVSDVDLIVVLPDDTAQENKLRLREEVERLETAHGFRPAHPPGRVAETYRDRGIAFRGRRFPAPARSGSRVSIVFEGEYR